jgi:cation-transporting ATPase E
VETRRARGLTNTAPDDTGRSFARILAANVFTAFNGIVGGCFVLLLVLGSWQDALFGFSVVANTAIGVVQEFRAKRTLAHLVVVSAPRAVLRRGGADITVAPADIVLGDLLVLRPGDQLVADAEAVEVQDLEVDESLLTGEADPVVAATGRELLSGSTVVSGSGLARVVRVGAASYSARLTAEARQFSLVHSEIRDALARVVRWLSVGLVPIGVLVVNGQMQATGGWPSAISSGSWRPAAVDSVASVIAMVPAGLVFMTSVALAVGAVRLAAGGVLVRELAAVEGLARVDILCIDKTGTLTDGGMALDHVDPVGHPAEGWQHALAALAADPAANATARAIGATFGPSLAPTDAPDSVVGFSSRHKWSGVHFPGSAAPGSWVLGGADVVLGSDATDAASAGESRTLVLAHSRQPMMRPEDRHLPQLPSGLEPVAVLVFREQIRADAAATIRFFDRHGVSICIISGDDPRTVASVAHRVGLPSTLVGVDARTLPTAHVELAEVLRTERIFGRVTPEQKKAMVVALRSLGHTVAMVGDGVNDTLALKHADLGIAMGSGSAAARAVAQVVLLDGSLSRLPHVVAEGRRVIANVERLAKLFLTKTVWAIALAVAFGLLLQPFPFLPRQLSVVDGLTIGLPGLVLALLPNEGIHRLGFLRRAGRFCIPSGLILGGAVLAVVGYARAGGATVAEVRTVAVITLTLSALWVLVVLARPFTRATGGVVVVAYAGLVAVIAVPVSSDFLHLALPSAPMLGAALVAAAVASALLELTARRLRHLPEVQVAARG